MTTLVTIQRKGQMTLPSRLRDAIGVSEGDRLEASVERGRIVLTPKLVVNRSDFPNADDDYTPAQRRVIDARLAKADDDIKHGRTYGPFETADEAIKAINKEIRARKAARKRKTTSK